MAKTLQDTITIKFVGKDEGLLKAIKSLDSATQSLLNAQAKLVDKERKGESTRDKHKKQIASLIISVQALGGKWSKNTTLLNLHKKALQGDRVAMQKLKNETAKYNAKLKNTKKGLLDTAHSTRILGGSFAVLRSKMLLASFAAGIVGATIGKLGKSFAIQELAERKLETALGRTSKALLEQASALQTQSSFGDEAIITQQAFLASLSFSENQISNMIPVAIDLAAALGISLESAVKNLSKTYSGLQGELGELVPQLKNLSVEQLKSGQALMVITELMGGSAKKQVKTLDGSLRQMGMAFGDLAEQLGSVVAPAIISTTNLLTTFLTATQVKLFPNVKEDLENLIMVNTELMESFRDGMNNGIGRATQAFREYEAIIVTLTEKLEKLNGVEKTATLQFLTKLDLLTLRNELTKDGNLSLDDQLTLIKTEQSANNLLVASKPTEIAFQERQQELMISENLLSKQIAEQKIKTVSTTIGALVQMNTAMKGSAMVSKRLAQAQAVIDTYAGANKALAAGVPPFNFIAMAGVVATGLANVATIESQKFEKGGLIGGRRHSQGGTMIEAEQGEFMMSRSAVNSIGVDTLSRMNQGGGGGGGITLNIQGGIVDESYVRNELIPALNQATSMGSRINA